MAHIAKTTKACFFITSTSAAADTWRERLSCVHGGVSTVDTLLQRTPGDAGRRINRGESLAPARQSCLQSTTVRSRHSGINRPSVAAAAAGSPSAIKAMPFCAQLSLAQLLTYLQLTAAGF